MNKKIAGAAAALAVSIPALLSAPAQAKDDDVVHRGSCSGATDSKIKAGADDGRLEVEAEIDSNRRGQTWRWALRRDGRLVARGRSVTAGRSGSFEVERRTRNAPGVDTLRFRAVNVRSGEICVARLRR